MRTTFITQRFAPGPAWLHFIVLGGLLHAAVIWAFPDPKPVLGPPSESRLAILAEGYAQMAGEPPTAAQRALFVERELRDELLFREAIASGLHNDDPAVSQRLIRNMLFLYPDQSMADAERIARGLALNMHLTDEVIRRRLVQMTEELLIAGANLPEPTTAELRASFDAQAEQWQEPARVSFEHVFLGNRDASFVDALAERFVTDDLTPSAALQEGLPFLEGYRFDRLSLRDVEGRLGELFASTLGERLDEHRWQGPRWLGPIESVFGWHLVHVNDYEPARPLRFEEVVDDLRWQLRTQREQAALDAAVTAMMTGYEVRRS